MNDPQLIRINDAGNHQIKLPSPKSNTSISAVLKCTAEDNYLSLSLLSHSRLKLLNPTWFSRQRIYLLSIVESVDTDVPHWARSISGACLNELIKAECF